MYKKTGGKAPSSGIPPLNKISRSLTNSSLCKSTHHVLGQMSPLCQMYNGSWPDAKNPLVMVFPLTWKTKHDSLIFQNKNEDIKIETDICLMLDVVFINKRGAKMRIIKNGWEIELENISTLYFCRNSLTPNRASCKKMEQESFKGVIFIHPMVLLN